MVIVENKQIENIPLLHIVKQEDYKDKLPLIIFIHGFTSGKENNLHYAYLLAEKGFRVLLPEALYHGERAQGLSEKELFAHFWEIVLMTIKEVSLLKDYFVESALADEERIGIAGTSMGGIATLGALTQYPWIKAAVSLMGSPTYEQLSLWQLEQLKSQGMKLPFNESDIEKQLSILRTYDLSQQPEKLNSRPLLFWHGKKDPIVPFSFTFEFYESLENQYFNQPERIKFIADEHADHKVSREGLQATIDWFENHL
ncbi:esterase [Bacillus sp. BRMEA1]|uniref:esterase n=1 Tax=Neobacillus endophyticus TaxID=2738405 RepID=UPI001563E0B4|nr:esterase [Neobacillus endophyticus]NRD78404.1 esterase [Neobacillus endophyticus]